MTRGRRDGILKSEKVRHVVKLGPMHLKGVWIPFERALDFANKENITDLLYPLFVHNIGSLLYDPSNINQRSQASAEQDLRDDVNFFQNQSRIATDVSMDSYLEGTLPSQPPTTGGNALQDYQMQLMLLEQENKKRLLRARKEIYET